MSAITSRIWTSGPIFPRNPSNQRMIRMTRSVQIIVPLYGSGKRKLAKPNANPSATNHGSVGDPIIPSTVATAKQTTARRTSSFDGVNITFLSFPFTVQ
jgi:hypothetical protein